MADPTLEDPVMEDPALDVRPASPIANERDDSSPVGPNRVA
ncbi:hypothetical protein OG689_38730 [Kitasatospora sp. NBC_00240]|nr:hypothetical protein [Kitasatospora sp. NBC_00240]MCX5215133.1 hypothetical protein [Kitasatospora sp. NBC_00240]